MKTTTKKLLLLLSFCGIVAATYAQTPTKNRHTIAEVEPVSVTTAVGTAPVLPYRLWVTYADGTADFRQVRWTNAALATEQDEADATKHPAGSTYMVRGYITGDNTTSSGYPIEASVQVTNERALVPSHTPQAEPLPLGKVQLIGDNRLTHNRDLDIDQLLSLDVKQQLYNYRDTYGLSTEGYPEADGWDSPTTKLKGHGSGHYMSALAMAYASCTDKAKRKQLKANIQTMVDELRRCQERTFVYDTQLGRYREARDFAPEDELRNMGGTWQDFDRYKQDYQNYGYGYLNAIPAQHCALIEMYRAYNNEQWVWAPYYSVHKQLAGLIDIATLVDDPRISRKALLIARDMGLWVWNRLHYRTYVSREGSQEERRARPGNRYEMWNMYIAGEVGGMAESLARLAELATSAEDRDRLIEAAGYFDSPAFFDPLANNIDAIRTRHANQHIPMVTGALRSYRTTADPSRFFIAQNFWTMIQGRYRYAMGGVGNGEMFRQPYTQMLSMNTNVGGWGRDRHPEPTINETCCAYNLAKLTKELNCFRPDDARYMDYYERVLYNQLVGSLHPDHYAVLYQYAVGLNASKPWGNETPQSTCCGGTGAENHVKYQEAAYFVNDNTLWVALYLPTTATWDAKKITLEQTCEWPAEHSVIRVTKGSATFSMKLRVPYWATTGFEVRLNGEPVASSYQPGTYVEIPARRWTKRDVVEITMPYAPHVDFGPDKMEIAATKDDARAAFTPQWLGTLMYGPLAMATTGIRQWNEAEFDLNADLSDIAVGNTANLHTLTFGNHTFIPDYAADRHTTHYLRLNLIGAASENVPELTTTDELTETALDESPLREAMQVARTRRDAQLAWNEMAVKVPEYAPWAPHGFRRMMEQYDRAQRVFDNFERTQQDINQQAAALNAAINTMRPGNLPELEDLDTLLPLLERAKALPSPTAAQQQAIDYAEMVVKYVSDGSGTTDMIQRAAEQLQKALQ
ncbi:MAG: glycoside hydrolase family 127 protein, partial [Prevotellaceae bacterium]|nr:glycoside hydrolase family 127 protein [Prevotellaceae bacterium]